ncbi:hypothetical protein R1sor_020380 [Riccia sorocarpa]|uniref:DUF4283 domain-containing protein n=1 Tax=Riccia sorocarpa TaxID=122646 RepID=A0ABD3IF63_9MARC
MVNSDTVRLEREYLMNSIFQIQQRVRSFIEVVGESNKLPEHSNLGLNNAKHVDRASSSGLPPLNGGAPASRSTARELAAMAEAIFQQTLGVQISSICSLSRNCFHVVLDSGTSRNHIFVNAPFYMGDAMVYVLPWDPRFNPNELRTRSVPIWVELPDVPPNCAAYGLAMLRTLGVLMYASRNIETHQSNLLKGCALMDITNCPDNRKEEDPLQVGAGGGPRPGIQRQEVPGRRLIGPKRVDEMDAGEGEENPVEVPRPNSSANPVPGQGEGANLPVPNGAAGISEGINDKDETGDQFMSFEEAEKSNGRSASRVNQDDPVRLSCVSGNRLEFSEGRKKSRNLDELEAGNKVETSKNSSGAESQRKGGNEAQQSSRQDQSIRNWVKGQGGVEILGLHETKAKEERAELGLRSIFPGGRVVIDYAQNERGGAAIVVSREMTVVAEGVKGDGSVAWVKIQTEVGTVGVASIYASTKSPGRIPLWPWLLELIEGERWILIGDYNSVELPEDTQGSSNLLNGTELRKWKNLVRGSELVDAFFVAVKRTGPRFTRQRLRVDRIEFARLDRCYFSDGADWIEQVLELKHDGSSALSDHYPVVISQQLVKEQGNQPRRWRSYFKFRTSDFASEEVKQR